MARRKKTGRLKWLKGTDMQIGVVDRDTHQFIEAENLYFVFSRKELVKLEEFRDFIDGFLSQCKEHMNNLDPHEDFHTHDHFSLQSKLWRMEDTDIEIAIHDEGEK